jgi:hypothetical protein
MTTHADFTEAEWAKLYRAPLVAGIGVTLADPGGPIEISKEGMAAMRTAVTPSGGQGLVADLSADLKVVLEARKNPVTDFKPGTGVDPLEMIMDELRDAIRIVSERANPEEATAYRTWILDSARNAAEAAKEGGFFGVGAVQVSEGEASFLSKLEEMLGEGAGS